MRPIVKMLAVAVTKPKSRVGWPKNVLILPKNINVYQYIKHCKFNTHFLYGCREHELHNPLYR